MTESRLHVNDACGNAPSLVTPEQPELDSSVLRDGVAAFERAFPERVRAYYLEGSWADHTALSTSDLDLVVVFKDQFLEGEQTRARQVQTAVAETSAVEFDASVVDEVAQLPVRYPDPSGAYFGYDRRPTRLPDGSTVSGTRDLVRSIGWAATALVAYRAGQYIARKSECHDMYNNHIGDEWAPLISDIYVLCRNRWHYVIPLDVADRQMLRSICERTLQFENYFLGLYREFLLEELSSGPPADGAHARWVLEQLPLADAAVRALI